MKNRKAKWIMAGILLLCLAGCGSETEAPVASGESAKGTIQATVAQAATTNQPMYYEAVGTVQSRVSATVSAKIMGTVKAVNVKEGDFVKAGDILVILDARQVQAQLKQSEAALEEARRAKTAAEAGLTSARSGYELAESTYRRYSKMYEQEAITRQEFEEVTSKHQQAAAAVEQAESMLAAARQRVQQAKAAQDAAQVVRSDAQVAAPYAGVITAKNIGVGDLASPGTPLLEMERVGDFQVDIVLPESHIRSVAPGMKVAVQIEAIGIKDAKGVVENIIPSANQNTRTFIVKVKLPAREGVRSGMFAQVAVPLGEEPMMLIPASALVTQGQLDGLYLVDDQQIARFRLVRIGRKFKDNVEVVSGLKNGWRYVVNPGPKMIDGMKVEVRS